MAAPLNLLTALANNLGQMSIEEAKYLMGAEEKLRELQMELSWMHSFLKDADEQRAQERVVHLWVASVRDLAYEAEALIETFDIKISSMRSGGLWQSLKRSACFFREVWLLHHIGLKMDKITAKISDLNRRAQAYGISSSQRREEPCPDQSCIERQRRQQFADAYHEKGVVGFDHYIDNLVSALGQYGVVCICGPGGLGKTALARKVYHHKDVRHEFEGFAWAKVSRQCKRREVWKQILSDLSREGRDKFKDMTNQDLEAAIRQILKENRCLVIVDDIWSDTDWVCLKKAFPPENETSSKILLTSRYEEVASDSNRFMLEPESLDKKQSWKLLKKFVFTTRETDAHSDIHSRLQSKDLKEIRKSGKEMVEHCEGLPLAVTVLGGLLRNKVTLPEWRKVHNKIHSSIHIERGPTDEKLGVRSVLASSYYDLPSHLKQCFLYLAQFPEDHEIRVDSLIQMWIAEGMIEPIHVHWGQEEEEKMEDIAQSYLMDLMERSMVLVGKQKANNEVKTCRLHNLMRHLCLSKAKENNFLHVATSSNILPPSSSTGTKIRRMAIHDSSSSALASTENVDLKSLWFFDKDCFSNVYPRGSLIEKFWVFISSNHRYLHVLNLEGVQCYFPFTLPTDIGELMCLKFFALGKVYASTLPQSLRHLKRLQTFHIKSVLGRCRLPNVIRKMKQLGHLYLPSRFEVHYQRKLRLGNLRNLLTLVNFRTTRCDIRDIQQMPNLRVLKLADFDISSELFSQVILNLKQLRSLRIKNDGGKPIDMDPILQALQQSCPYLYKLSVHSAIRKFPNMLSTSISHITLSYCNLKGNLMGSLEKVPKLRLLKLSSYAIKDEKIFCSARGFPQLQSLILSHLDFEEWTIEKGAMPKLRNLVIDECSHLKMIPEGLKSITRLEELEILRMPKGFCDRLAPKGEDFHKVQHIPSRTIALRYNIP